MRGRADARQARKGLDLSTQRRAAADGIAGHAIAEAAWRVPR